MASESIFPGGVGVTTRTAAELISDDMVFLGTDDVATASAVAYEAKYSVILEAIQESFYSVGDCGIVGPPTAPAHWCLMNGDTIGSTASSADLDDDGYEELFLWLWGNYDNTDAPVTGGRGASAAADWAADKVIGLPEVASLSSLAAVIVYGGEDAPGANTGYTGK